MHAIVLRRRPSGRGRPRASGISCGRLPRPGRAALDAGCTVLLSEDMQAGQRIPGLRIANPFAR